MSPATIIAVLATLLAGIFVPNLHVPPDLLPDCQRCARGPIGYGDGESSPVVVSTGPLAVPEE